MTKKDKIVKGLEKVYEKLIIFKKEKNSELVIIYFYAVSKNIGRK